MGRMAVITVCFLLLGAGVNAAVAWHVYGREKETSFWRVLAPYNPSEHGLMRYPSIEGEPRRTPGILQQLHDQFTRTPRKEQYAVLGHAAWGYDRFVLQNLPHQGYLETRGTFAGWPRRSFWMWTQTIEDYAADTSLTRSGGDRWRDDEGKVILPTRILWPGLLLNTALYSVALWIMWLALIPLPRAIRRRRRLRRGRCSACGYPAGESPVCTECGEKLLALAAPAA